MLRKIRKILLWTIIVLIVLLGVFVLLYSYTPLVDQTVLKFINSALGDDINIHYDRIEGNLIGNIRLINVTLQSPQLKVNAKKITVSHDSRDLTNKIIRIKSLLIDSPQITFFKSTTVAPSSGETSVSLEPESLGVNIDLSQFPIFYLNEFLVKNGQVTLKSGDEELQHFQDINAEGSIEISNEKADFKLKYIKGYWREKDLHLTELSFQAIGNKKRLTINQINFLVEENKIYAHGEIELSPHLRFLVFADTSNLELSLLRKFIPDLPYQEGNLRFYIDYIGVPTDFTGQIYLTGRLDSLNLNRISSKYQYRKRNLNLQDMRIQTNFGSLGGSILIAPEGKNNIAINFREINLKKPGFSGEATNINGYLRLNFNTWNLSQITGAGIMQLTDLQYGQVKLDTLFMNLEAQDGFWTLKNGSRLVVQKESQFYVNGIMSKEHFLDVYLSTNRNVLDTLSHRLNLPEIKGIGSLDLKITGPSDNPDIAGSVLLDSLVIQDVSSYGVEGNFELRGVMKQRKGFFNLELAGGLFADFMITDGVMDLKLDYNVLQIDSMSFYNEDNYINLKGRMKLLEKLLEIQFWNLVFQYQNYRIFSGDTLQAFLENDSLIIENFELFATGDGEIEVRGLFDFNGESGLGIYFHNIQLFPFNQFFLWKYDVNGVVDISLTVTGAPDSLRIQGYVDLLNFALNKDKIGDLTAKLTYADNKIQFDRFYFEHAPGSFLSLQGDIVLPASQKTNDPTPSMQLEEQFNIGLEFANIKLSDYPFLSQQNYPLNGVFAGKFKVEGTLSRFLANYHFNAQHLQYREYIFPEINLNGFMNPEAIVLEDGLINFMGTKISVQGEKPIRWNYQKLDSIFANQEFSLQIQMQEDSVKFLNVLTPEVDLLTGEIFASFDVGGTLEQPRFLSGRFDIKNGNLYLSKIENPFTAIQFKSNIENNQLIIQQCQAYSYGDITKKGILQRITSFLTTPIRKVFFKQQGEGELKINGNIDFADMFRPKIDLKIQANHVFINYFLENTQLNFSTNNLTITGRDTLLIAGNINVHKGEVILDLVESEKNLLLTTTVRETPPYLQYLITVSIPGNFYIRSSALFNSFDIMIMGDLQVIQEPKGLLEMYGNLEVPKGKYFQFEEFVVRDGRVEFSNPKELPNLKIYAETKKYGYIFQLHVEGNMNNPVKEIRIFDLQTREDVTHLYPSTKDQISLLLFGMTFNEIGGSAAGNIALDKGQEVINQAIISRIENEARRFIGLDEVRLESQSGLIDFNNLRLNQISENSAISLGKYVMPNLYVEYKTQLGSKEISTIGEGGAPKLGWEAGNQIYLEYRINKNWSVSSYYARQLYDKFKIDVNWRYSF